MQIRRVGSEGLTFTIPMTHFWPNQMWSLPTMHHLASVRITLLKANRKTPIKQPQV